MTNYVLLSHFCVCMFSMHSIIGEICAIFERAQSIDIVDISRLFSLVQFVFGIFVQVFFRIGSVFVVCLRNCLHSFIHCLCTGNSTWRFASNVLTPSVQSVCDLFRALKPLNGNRFMRLRRTGRRGFSMLYRRPVETVFYPVL